MKKYGTLKQLSAAPEAEIAQLLHINADAASELLLHARQALKKQDESKQKQMQSLDVSGTTWQKAAHYKMISDLALLAGGIDGTYEENEDINGGNALVASPEPKTDGKKDE